LSLLFFYPIFGAETNVTNELMELEEWGLIDYDMEIDMGSRIGWKITEKGLQYAD